MAFDKDSQEARMGALAESDAARLLQRRGVTVLPAFSLLDNTDDSKAPLIYSSGTGKLVSPDLLCFNAGRTTWIDVKGKAIPGWKITHARWEHGIDYANFLEYEHVATETRFPCWLLLREQRSPSDPDCWSELVPSSQWLTISVVDARHIGEHRPTWPGGVDDPQRRGRKRMGGWLWPRSAMRAWDVDNR